MRTQAEVRERLEHWRSVLDGVVKGEETKKTIRQIIGELEWVLAEKGKARQNAELDL